MNKFLVSSNVVLIIAVIILFVLHFNKHASTSAIPETGVKSNSVINGGFKMGYFETDSLDNNYKYEQDVKNELITADKNLEKQLNQLQQELRDRYIEIQKKGPNMSQAEQVQYSNELDQMQKANQEKAQRLQQSMSIEHDTKMRQVKQSIQNYLKSYAHENGYNYIVGTNEDDFFYYKDSAQDITSQLVQKLNQIYTDSLKNAGK
ncbi:MAG: OmpH family outer membrane protein [Arachidicoccus sp.]|nr:OmpH family outer membrane protein [Arachidicoccus sp.]